ncbi:hypothetical protein JCM6882_001504 [Rhodosporidiobolus microsporus]
MDSDQPGWLAQPLPDAWSGLQAASWEESDVAQKEIEARVTEQHLNHSLGPSLEAFGLNSAPGGVGAEAPSTGQGGGASRSRQPSTEDDWARGRSATMTGAPEQNHPPAPPPPLATAFPGQQPPLSFPPTASGSFSGPSYPFPPHAAPPLPAPPRQEQLPAWLYQTGPLPEPTPSPGAAVVSGMGQMRAASSDYGQPPSGQGGTYLYSYGVPNPHHAPVPSPSTAFPFFPPPPPQYGSVPVAPPPTDLFQQPPHSTQAVFKSYWQQQAAPSGLPPVPSQFDLSPTALPDPSPSLDGLASASIHSSATLPQLADHQQQWSTPLGTPQSIYSPFVPTPEYGTGAPSYFPPPAQPNVLGVPPAESAAPLPLQPASISLNFGFPDPAPYTARPSISQPPSLPLAPVETVNLNLLPGPSYPLRDIAPAVQLDPIQSSSAAVDFAASNQVLQASAPKRARTTSTKAGGSSRASLSGPSRRASTTVSDAKPGKKLTIDLPTSCVRCAKLIGRLILRGKAHEINVPHEAVFTCSDCAAAAESPSSLSSPPSDSSGVAAASTSKAKPKTKKDKDKAPTYRKKNKRLDDRSSLTACDVCLRDVAVGGVLPSPVENPPAGARIDFMIEVVCVSCDSKYRRCTDCGGGGGTRAGTGKWRCKELFLDGRKTCCLSHQRLGAFPDMNYEVWNIRDIPGDEVDDLSERCERIFRNQMLAGICIPEVLEQDGAIYTNYEMADMRARLGWKGFDPMIRNDIEHTESIRRYLALRTCTPNRRKTTRQQKEDEEAAQARKACKENPVVLPNGKEIAGYIVAEWEIKLGHVFLAIVIPWDPTGETFDATTLLIGSLVRRVDQDIREMNELRASRGEPLVPGLTNVWTMLFFKKESRMLTHLIKKRDFLFIEDFLQKYPETEPKHFPPHRPCYVPLERQPGWQILIRRQKTYSDGRFDDWNARRAIDEERGKKKEAKARAAREKLESGEAETK